MAKSPLRWLLLVLLPCCLLVVNGLAKDALTLEEGFANPPPEAKLRAYWWWLNGNVTREAITTDLEGMAAQGFGGAILCDADGSNQDGNARTPHGPTFASPEWRELYKHALREAARLDLEISLNIQSGWNLGGPMVRPDEAPKKLVWSETLVPVSSVAVPALPEPKHPPAFYRDVAVLAFPTPLKRSGGLKNLAFKALQNPLGMSAPDTHVLFEDDPATPDDENILLGNVLDVSDRLRPDGTLNWTPPPISPATVGGTGWTVLRFGCTINDHCRVSTCSEGWDGYALDPYDEAPFRRYWDAVVEQLLADAGSLKGKTLRYLHTDSWEVEAANWTPTLREEFRARRGYELRTYLPVVAGRIVGDRETSNRFLEDLRRTMGDLAVDHHYKPFLELAHRHGLEIHPESGGPHASPFDAQQCLGLTDAPMSEFWAKSPRHRTTDAERFFVKQPASAAHTNGKKLVLAEGFTTIGTHWQESLASNLKPSFDQAVCEGLNRLVWHAFVCSPEETGTPGQQYFAGTHFDPKTTWFKRSGTFLKYINRCQFMMQRGLPVADVLYYYGDHVPNFAQLRASDPARLGAGRDYDVASADVLLTRASVREGCIVLPDGVSYRALVLPDYPAISLPVLRKVRELVLAGATVVGSRPQRASGLSGYPESDAEVASIADELWPDKTTVTGVGSRLVGKGRVYDPQAQNFQKDDAFGDADCSPMLFSEQSTAEEKFGFVHRRDGVADIYFVVNRTAEARHIPVIFRVGDRQPELWDPVTGERRLLAIYAQDPEKPQVTLPLAFEPYGSWLVVFREPPTTPPQPGDWRTANFPGLQPTQELTGPWTVHFDPTWGGPASAEFPTLTDWTKRPEEGIRFYSGTAVYETSFDCPAVEKRGGNRLQLDLGDVREMGDVTLNGKPLGNVWTPPYRVDITDAVQPTGNRLRVEVTNLWANRVIGDAGKPEAQRLTRTNVRRLTKDTLLMPSGLLGPVQVFLSASSTPLVEKRK